jgi:peptidoglycan hydrolase CwlO-like protein
MRRSLATMFLFTVLILMCASPAQSHTLAPTLKVTVNRVNDLRRTVKELQRKIYELENQIQSKKKLLP